MKIDKRYGRARREEKCLSGNKRNVKAWQLRFHYEKQRGEFDAKQLKKIEEKIIWFEYLVKNHVQVMKERREK